jgi:hypothetical protein
MAALTLTEKANIASNSLFQARIKEIMLVKANYWKNLTTPNRGDVNIRHQKRNKLGKSILLSPWVDNYKSLVSEFFLSQYSTSNPDLNETNQPSDQALNDNFDITYDFFAGVVAGDETNQNIDW